MEYDVLIIGGGLAGLTAAIHLSRAGIAVVLLEKNNYPRHRVCGEYVSNEVLPYFASLGIGIDSLNPVRISKAVVSTCSGRKIEAKLPLGGFGLSRFSLDNLMFETAKANGCVVRIESVDHVSYSGNRFSIVSNASRYTAKIVIGAHGKRANVDSVLKREFMSESSPWLAVKAHYNGVFPSDVVGLHNFRGGYCGVSRVEGDQINVCYLANFETFKKYKNIDDYQAKVLSQNPNLKAIFETASPVFKPIAISQVSFAKKLPVENHILMAGDSAGLIHPLCGNGMAMAVHSAKFVSELIIDYLTGKIHSRKALERQYTIKWNEQFRRRMRNGRWLSRLMHSERAADFAMRILSLFPFLLPAIIAQTHGKPIEA